MPPIINTKALADAMPRSSRRRLAERRDSLAYKYRRVDPVQHAHPPYLSLKRPRLQLSQVQVNAGYDAAAVDNRENPHHLIDTLHRRL